MEAQKDAINGRGVGSKSPSSSPTRNLPKPLKSENSDKFSYIAPPSPQGSPNRIDTSKNNQLKAKTQRPPPGVRNPNKSKERSLTPKSSRSLSP
eukprot:334161_1